jgi:serine/threonine protein kinase/predicted negative regulator of RcsB-dependent stress response
MNKRTPSVETLLSEAVEIASTVDRQAFVERSCAGDPALQERVERMIADHFQAGSFLERPASPFDAHATGAFAPTFVDDKPGTMIGPYKLLEQIGEGGMGVVYVAEQQKPVRRRVALKIIKPGMDSRQVVARFEAERQALAMMDHPNIAKVFDGGAIGEVASGQLIVARKEVASGQWSVAREENQDPGLLATSHSSLATPVRPYFVMELVKGAPITEYCDTHRLSTRQRLKLFLDVCGAVQHAHQKGIIHRDLKPSNILVSLHDVTPIVKVIDFGIAKATGGQLTDKTVYTQVAQLIGTPMYMSPEQAGLSDLDVDTRSDVCSLGVLLYELLTGTTPFDGETLKKAGFDEMRRIIREDEPPRPSARLTTMEQAALTTIAERRGQEPQHISRHLRGELDWIVMRALEKDRNRRYESASTFAADLQRYLDDEPVQACPPSTTYRLRKFTRRNKAFLTTVLAVAIALVLGTGISIWQALEADHSRQLADNRLKKETEARDEAEKQSRRAQAGFSKAVEAVKKMLTEVSDEQISAIPQMRETRIRLLENAVAFYTELIALNPDDAQTYYERAIVYDLLANHDRQRADLLKAIELDPNNADLHGMLAFSYRGDEKAKQLILLHTKRAAEIEPKGLTLMELAAAYELVGQVDQAKAVLQKVAEQYPDALTTPHSLGEAALRRGDLKSARAHFEKAVEQASFAKRTKDFKWISPPTWHVYMCLSLARVLCQLGDDAEALLAFNRSLEVVGASGMARAQALQERGEFYATQGKYEAALVDYDAGMQLYPEAHLNWHMYKRRGWLHFRVGHYDLALADIGKAVELKPDDVSNLFWISAEEVAACSDANFRKGFIALTDRTVAVLSENADERAIACLIRAQLLEAWNQQDRANADWERLRDWLEGQRKKDGPKSADTAGFLAMLGIRLLKLQKYKEAESILRECLTIREQLLPDNWVLFNTRSMLGGALLGQKKYAEAEPLLLQGYEGMKQRRSQIHTPGLARLPEAVERLVSLYEATNQAEKAKAWREKLPADKGTKK